MLDEFNEFCDRLEKTSEWGGQAEVFHFALISMHMYAIVCYSVLKLLLLSQDFDGPRTRCFGLLFEDLLKH